MTKRKKCDTIKNGTEYPVPCIISSYIILSPYDLVCLPSEADLFLSAVYKAAYLLQLQQKIMSRATITIHIMLSSSKRLHKQFIAFLRINIRVEVSAIFAASNDII